MKPGTKAAEGIRTLYNALSTFACLFMDERLPLTFKLMQQDEGRASD